ncbi:hypothetical protein BT96DRAFT_570405 [Gymnopus androsaceus JB14]|uniref:DUF7918 domain-containing protein n=1 Tax=Gymnopus androsaceus JB14 TaxID=1447944 RepID=A0A6A4HVY5_9AGAR|nr:hypothetical protein BT96DRAFT_570405 [Gymnopus androsaceus JB14]
MLSLGPYSAWISVDGVGLDTHCAVSSRNGNSTNAAGYISSEAGKSFSVFWHNAIRDVALEAIITIDGVECSRHVMLPAQGFPDKPDTLRVSYTRTSDYTRRDLVFSEIQVTDDDDHLSTVDYTKFGVIILDLWRLHINRVVRQPLQHEYSSTTLESQVLHERSKKGGTHHVKFGEEYNVPLPTVDMVDGHKMDTRPYVSFTFRYRPRDILLAQGIIPRPLVPASTTRTGQSSRSWEQQHPSRKAPTHRFKFESSS